MSGKSRKNTTKDRAKEADKPFPRDKSKGKSSPAASALRPALDTPEGRLLDLIENDPDILARLEAEMADMDLDNIYCGPEWPVEVARIPREGITQSREATPEERAALGEELGLTACQRLTATYTIKPQPLGRFVVEGTLEADITQECVVTLEPVRSHLIEPFTAEFWPLDQIEEVDIEADDFDPASIEEEAYGIVDGRIDLGSPVFEALMFSIDMFPRHPDAGDDEGTQSSDGGKGAANPFAALAALMAKKAR